MRTLAIGAMTPEGVAHRRARGIEVDDAGPHRGVVEVMQEVEKAVDADFARIVRVGP